MQGLGWYDAAGRALASTIRLMALITMSVADVIMQIPHSLYRWQCAATESEATLTRKGIRQRSDKKGGKASN